MDKIENRTKLKIVKIEKWARIKIGLWSVVKIEKLVKIENWKKLKIE